MPRRRHPAFVPRSILNAALVAVVPAIASCASRRQEPTVAQMGFVATGGSADPEAANTASDASENPSPGVSVIDAGAAPSPDDASALVPNQITPPPQPLPVANQGFEINPPTVAQQAFETERVSRDRAAGDGGARTRRRR